MLVQTKVQDRCVFKDNVPRDWYLRGSATATPVCLVFFRDSYDMASLTQIRPNAMTAEFVFRCLNDTHWSLLPNLLSDMYPLAYLGTCRALGEDQCEITNFRIDILPTTFHYCLWYVMLV